MKLGEHLIYIDITNICDLNCEFCMYKDKRDQPQNLKLDLISKKNLHSLINDAWVKYVTISGEGEPFKNMPTLKDILEISEGNKNFQIITNGNLPINSIKETLLYLNNIAKNKNDSYCIRISIDSYHSDKIDSKKYLKFIEVLIKEGLSNTSLAFRSIFEDKDFIRDLMKSLLSNLEIDYRLVSPSELDDDIIINDKKIHINYKNLVNPSKLNRKDVLDGINYMKIVSKKYGRPFTFGNLKTSEFEKGLDITIKPNGDVFFYGIEIKPFGNIFKEDFSMDYFIKVINEHPLLHALYSKNFERIVEKLCRNMEIKKKLEEINNPYWFIKYLYRYHKNELEKAIGLC